MVFDGPAMHSRQIERYRTIERLTKLLIKSGPSADRSASAVGVTPKALRAELAFTTVSFRPG